MQEWCGKLEMTDKALSLTHNQITNFRLVEIETVCRPHFKFDKIAESSLNK